MDSLTRRRTLSLLGATAFAPVPVWADPGALDAVADRLVASGANVHSILVMRGGRMVFERYFSGSDEIQNRRVKNLVHDADTLHDMKSVTKGIASLAIGIAIDRGLIKSVDQPIMDFFPELSDMRTPERDRLRLVHALTMTVGLRWIEATPATGDDNDESRMHMSRDQCRYVLGLPVTAPPGQEFFYNTGTLQLLSAIMRKVTGHPLDEFVRANLLEPMGITGIEWNRIRGDTDAGGGLRLKPRDMVNIGQLVLAGGNWNGRQLVSKAWIDDSMVKRTTASANYDYGYLWWLGRAPFNGREVRVLAALGRGGQSIRVVPDLDLVMAVTAGYYQDYSEQSFALQRTVFDDVLRTLPN
jgi:CubicO group peptidase (beta-lactamase class C family)